MNNSSPVRIERITKENDTDVHQSIQKTNIRIKTVEHRVEALEHELKCIKDTQHDYEEWRKASLGAWDWSIQNMTIHILWGVLMLLIIYAALLAMWNHKIK